MADTKNIFISHLHEDDELIPDLKNLIVNSGMEVRDYSITDDKQNHAHDPDYIKYQILAPRIDTCSTLVVLITNDTSESEYVNFEIRYANSQGKRVVGVFGRGCTEADIPEELERCGDAAIVGWQGDRVVDAINGKISAWDDPQSGLPRNPKWPIRRVTCT
jgi:hypothetical protein